MDCIIKNYSKEKYKVIFNTKTGFFARIEQKGEKEPFWSPAGPELLDISITNRCDMVCSFCYKNSHSSGLNMPFKNYLIVMNEAIKNNVYQVALGGGNPNQHPQFCEILKTTRKDYGIIPSYTTNGNGLTPAIVEATKKYCGAVAVSAYPPYKATKKAIDVLTSNQIRTNLHYLLNSETIENVLLLLKNGSNLFENINAIIFINYKPVGKNKNNNLLLNSNKKYKELFNLINISQFPFKIGFDSCSISGIVNNLNQVNIASIEPCEAGRFSAYVSEDLSVYPCSFMAEMCKGESLLRNNLLDIWSKSKLFSDIRDLLSGNKCKHCSYQNICFNGCPVFSNINLCDMK